MSDQHDTDEIPPPPAAAEQTQQQYADANPSKLDAVLNTVIDDAKEARDAVDAAADAVIEGAEAIEQHYHNNGHAPFNNTGH